MDACNHNHHNPYAFVALLKACAKQKDLNKGIVVHADILKAGLLEKSPPVGSTLVSMYAKCGALSKAQQVLYELPHRDVVSWSAIITGYAQNGNGEEALNCFEGMQSEGISPDAVTFASVLCACGSIRAVEKGKQIHAEIVRQGLLGKDVVLGNALVDMYVKCRQLGKAHQVLDELFVRDVVSWSALIAGYTEQGHAEDALNCFERMQCEGLSPTAITFSYIFKACGSICATDKGEKLYVEIVKRGLLEKNVVLGGALVDMYAKCGALAKAQEVLDELPVRNVVCWSAVITGYANQGKGKEAIKCFEQMQHDGLTPDAVTFACILKACGNIGASDKGKQIHVEIVRQGLLGKNIMLGNALVDMYAKCGALANAQEVLDELCVRDIVCWNALIAGYAQHGHDEEVLKSFERMQWEGLSPNAITFASVLKACSHCGLLDKGQMYFEDMSTNYGIVPNSEHHACMVDLFGRAGFFDKALGMIRKMPSSDYLPVWCALLGACRKWGNVKLGRLAFERSVQLCKTISGAYVLMSNIYAAAGMQEDADKIEAMRVKNEAWKKPGCVWSIEAK